MPAFKTVKIGVWEFGRFVGVVTFGSGANRNMAGEYGLAMTECCELTRVALSAHTQSVSRIVSIAIKMIARRFTKLRLIVSYADPEQGHVGVIYQAMGWHYLGRSNPQRSIVGMHKRSASSRFGSITGLRRTDVQFKHRYLYPLDPEMRSRIEPLRKPYPKRVTSLDSEASANHAEEGGASPTVTL